MWESVSLCARSEISEQFAVTATEPLLYRRIPTHRAIRRVQLQSLLCPTTTIIVRWRVHAGELGIGWWTVGWVVVPLHVGVAALAYVTQYNCAGSSSSSFHVLQRLLSISYIGHGASEHIVAKISTCSLIVQRPTVSVLGWAT